MHAVSTPHLDSSLQFKRVPPRVLGERVKVPGAADGLDSDSIRIVYRRPRAPRPSKVERIASIAGIQASVD